MADFPQLDFSTLGNLGKTYNDARVQAVREQSLAALGQGASLADVSRALMQSGDIEGGMSLARLGQQDRQFGFQQQEAQRAQGNVDRSFALQQKQAEEAARGFDYREIDDNGNKVLVRINKQTGQTERVPISGVSSEPTNPFAYGKQNETQSKDSGFANRMFNAEAVLRDPKVESAATSLSENVKGMAPGFVSNYLTSPDYQKFDQAKRDFVNAVLRRESGAAISSSEFDNAHKQYFPQPGDTPERIAQKRANRQAAIAGVAGGGGPTYRPPFVFNERGDMTPTGNPKQGVRSEKKTEAPSITKETVMAARANPQQALAEARDAIAAGKPRDAIIKRLQQVGIDPSGL